MGVHPGVESSMEDIHCGVVACYNGAARRELALGARSAQENHGGLDNGRPWRAMVMEAALIL